MGLRLFASILAALSLALPVCAEECDPNPGGQTPPQPDPNQGGPVTPQPDPGQGAFPPGPNAGAGAGPSDPGSSGTTGLEYPFDLGNALGLDGWPGADDLTDPRFHNRAFGTGPYFLENDYPPPDPGHPQDPSTASGPGDPSTHTPGGGTLTQTITSGAFFVPGWGPIIVPIIPETATTGEGSVILIINGEETDELEEGVGDPAPPEAPPPTPGPSVSDLLSEVIAWSECAGRYDAMASAIESDPESKGEDARGIKLRNLMREYRKEAIEARKKAKEFKNRAVDAARQGR